MFDGLQILSNTIKHHQTRSNSTKQGVQTVKCLVTKQCLMVFGCQTFPVCPGLNPPEEQKDAQLSNTEIKLLSRGLTFVPTPKRIIGQKYRLISAILQDVYDLKNFFIRITKQTNQTRSHSTKQGVQTVKCLVTKQTNPCYLVKRFRCKGTWTLPNGRHTTLDAFLHAIENIITCKSTPIRNNLSRKERKAIATLRKRKDIVIKDIFFVGANSFAPTKG